MNGKQDENATEYLVVIRGSDREYPNERFKILSDKVIEDGNVFSVKGSLFSVIEANGTILYCSENVEIFEVEKIN